MANGTLELIEAHVEGTASCAPIGLRRGACRRVDLVNKPRREPARAAGRRALEAGKREIQCVRHAAMPQQHAADEGRVARRNGRACEAREQHSGFEGNNEARDSEEGDEGFSPTGGCRRRLSRGARTLIALLCGQNVAEKPRWDLQGRLHAQPARGGGARMRTGGWGQEGDGCIATAAARPAVRPRNATALPGAERCTAGLQLSAT